MKALGAVASLWPGAELCQKHWSIHSACCAHRGPSPPATFPDNPGAGGEQRAPGQEAATVEHGVVAMPQPWEGEKDAGFAKELGCCGSS